VLDEPLPATRVRAQEIVRRIVQTAEHAEVPAQCSSTTGFFVELHWSCGGEKRQPQFTSSECDPKEFRDVLPANAYSRARQLYAVGLETLNQELAANSRP
jgi:hypothetical protein